MNENETILCRICMKEPLTGKKAGQGVLSEYEGKG